MNIKKKSIKMEKNLMNYEHRWKLRDRIPIKKLNWFFLSGNPSAIHFLEANTAEIHWRNLCSNPLAIHLLEANPDKICWENLSQNPSIFELDYGFLRKRMNIIRNELIEKILHGP